jgi:hypothetical protein
MMEELKAQESEALDILEAMLDVCDLDNPGPMFAGQHVRGGICKVMDDDAAKLRQYIAARRAAPENKALTLDELRGMDGEPVWVGEKDQRSHIGKCGLIDVLGKRIVFNRSTYVSIRAVAGKRVFARRPEDATEGT